MGTPSETRCPLPPPLAAFLAIVTFGRKLWVRLEICDWVFVGSMGD
jgi:hypothetical protein